MKPLVEALEDGGVDVVLGAHEHLYERFKKKEGIRHFVVGTGGRSLYAVEQRADGSEFVDDENFGVLEVRLRRSDYAWRFIASGGEVLDKGEGTCG